MKKIILVSIVFLLGIASTVKSQDKYICKTGHVWFFSHTSVEDIEAHNNEAASVLNSANGDIIFKILVKSFKFKRALMEEHFNENYMESDKYPKSEFNGKIVNLSEINFSKNGTYKATVEGDLTIHNKANKVKENGTIEVSDGKITVKAKFSVVPQDYNIEIPSAVKDKFAKSMDVTVEMEYTAIKK